MASPNRFEIIAPLPSTRRHLHMAVDRGSHPPRAVVLAIYPRALSDDPSRLGRLSGEMERAAQLFHPNILAPVGIEVVGDDLAAVTVWRDAITLREILDAGGRLPSDIAARIAADVCAGLGHAHGRPEPVVHGLLGPEAVLVDESGTALVAGFGMPGGSSISDDVLGVGEILHECLAGEPPENPSASLEAPGVPVSLAAVVNKARATEPEARHPTADALGAAVAQAVLLAPRETVAAYIEAIVPAGSGLRAERRKKIEAMLAATPSVLPVEISEHDIVGAATPAPGEVATPEPALTPSATGVEAHPVGKDKAEPSGTGAMASSSGATSSATSSTSSPTPVPTSTPTPAPVSTSTRSATDPHPAAVHPAHGAGGEAPASSQGAPIRTATAIPVEQYAAPVHHERSTAGGPRVSLAAAIAMCLGGVVLGFALARLDTWSGLAGAAGRSAAEEARRSAAEAQAPADTNAPEPVVPPASPARSSPPPRAPARAATKSASAKKRASVRRADARAHGEKSGTGLLDVSAPEGAEIWLDGRRIGAGSLRRQIPEGSHRVEVRHDGASVAESFHVAPGETWTYVVTPR